ncbi:hypothetical protein FAZ69_17365 [Trinickia terrae]|uniref:Uncharacterized protein n=1 Tax=Trinickia terrae TaxID=2571161 RepID=A0A4U1I429_9BURK|nr:hypothetical protein [Trinickia terrae]TKC88021.1 hypothetical protein FAZ69_17365 [Trinickia terrae]
MQRVTFVRYAVKPECAAENEALSRTVFAELREAKPENVVYALFRSGLEFVHVFVNLTGDDSAVLTELPSFKAYAKDVSARCETEPEVTRLGVELLESYGFNTKR